MTYIEDSKRKGAGQFEFVILHQILSIELGYKPPDNNIMVINVRKIKYN